MFYRILLAFACSSLMLAAATAADHPGTEIEFRILETDHPVSGLAMSEDGRQLVVLHLQANAVSIIDTETGQVRKVFRCNQPGAALCRNGRLYVGSQADGGLSVYSMETWEILDKIPVCSTNFIFLTAPQGQHFDGTLLAKCRDPRMNPQEYAASIYLIDTLRGSSRLINNRLRHNFAVDAAGKSVFLSNYNLSGSCDYGDFLGGMPEKSLRTVNIEGTGSIPYMRQLGDSPFWISYSFRMGNRDELLYPGLPPQAPATLRGSFVIPDHQGTYVYTLSNGLFSAIQPAAGMAVVASQPVQLPATLTHNVVSNEADVYSDQAFFSYAVRHHGDVHLFLFKDPRIMPRGTMLYHAVFPGLMKTETSDNRIPGTAIVGQRLTCRISAETVRGATILNGPDNASVTPAGVLSWTPAQPGVGQFKIRAVVGEKTEFLRFAIEAVAPAPKSAPAP